MEIIKAIILGIIQGITEFLPISSSGHLVLAQKIMGFTEPPLIFDTVLHLGTLFAVVLVLWSDIWPLLKKPFQKMTGLLAHVSETASQKHAWAAHRSLSGNTSYQAARCLMS